MDWIFDHFQILLIVGLAFASWLKSRNEAKQAEREAREAGEMPDMRDIFGPEESWQPEPEPYQPPPLPAASYSRPAPPAYEETNALRELERQSALREQLKQIRESKAITGNAAATRERNSGKGKAPASVTASLRETLRNRSELRKAVITREILGAPLGLR
jgi:predicted ATPase